MSAIKKTETPNPEAAEAPVKVTDVPPTKEFTGSLLLQVEPFEFCPDALLDRIGFAKESRPVFILRPLNAKQRQWMESEDKRVAAAVMLWAKQNNIDFANSDNCVMLLYKFKELSNADQRREIVRRCIVGFKNEAGVGAFVKSTDDDGLHPDIFDRLPEELVSAIDAKLYGLAGLLRDEVLGL